MTTPPTRPFSPAALGHWLTARSLARGLPAPQADRGGYRVDTNSETERCRWVFAHLDSGIADLAQSIHDPLEHAFVLVESKPYSISLFCRILLRLTGFHFIAKCSMSDQILRRGGRSTSYFA